MQPMTEIHYFDHAATTPMSQRAIQRYAETASSYIGNPSALHQEGIRAKALLEELRDTLAKHLDVQPSSLYFTGGGVQCVILPPLEWGNL